VIHLATGIAVRDGRVLLAASRYPNQPEPLWNLPGGRQQPGELLAETVVREFFEETGFRVRVAKLAYVSESYAGKEHILNATFEVFTDTDAAPGDMFDNAGDHVVEVAWVPLDEVARRIVVQVVREPLLAYLHGTLSQRYAGFHDAGITIEWPADSK
jgi:8-oxo-dGTP pyrophosphatase MutT (NUDIX family)